MGLEGDVGPERSLWVLPSSSHFVPRVLEGFPGSRTVVGGDIKYVFC